MHVQVKHRLTGARAGIDNRAVTLVSVVLLVSHACPDTQQVSKQNLIFLRGIVEGFEMFPRDHQKMRGRLRMNITNHHATLILKYKIAGNLARDDADKTNNSLLPSQLLLNWFKFGRRYRRNDAFNVGANRTQLCFDLLVTTIDVVNAIDQRLVSRNQSGKHQRC